MPTQPQAHNQSAATPSPLVAAAPRDGTRPSKPGARRLGLQYLAAFGAFAAMSLLNVWLRQWIGYQAIALVYLLAVVVLALFVSRGPILFGTALTALGWGFIAPPTFTFRISSTYDKMMVVTYFAVALTIGELMARLRAHREAEMKARLVAESERLGRTLLSSVSHELRTPIAAITGAASGLRTSGELSEPQQKLAAEIESAAARLNRVVQSLLSAARLQSGQVRSRPDWCDVSELIDVTLLDVESFTAGRTLNVQLAPGLPLVKMDFVLMGQALANLIVNAAMHTPPGTPVDVCARLEDRELWLEVMDRGPGLPPGSLERIFDPFYRTSAAKTGGTGLGLAIVRGFVEAQNGTTLAFNRPGGGAVFRIRLPANDVPELPDDSA